MKLNEFFTHTASGFEQDKTYEPENDISILDDNDTRKTRLSLKDINSMRLASEAHDAQQKEEAVFNAQYSKNQKIMDHVQWFKPSLGWSSGPTALRMACEHGYKDIHILGFDYQGLSENEKKNRFKVNNMFKDTRNYKKGNDEATFFGNWMNQTKKCLKDFPDVKFHRVIPNGWFQPKDLDWAGNIDHPSIEEFLSKFDLQLKI